MRDDLTAKPENMPPPRLLLRGARTVVRACPGSRGLTLLCMRVWFTPSVLDEAQLPVGLSDQDRKLPCGFSGHVFERPALAG